MDEYLDIRFDEVSDLHIEKLGVIYKLDKPPYADMAILESDDFERFKFELIKWIKTKKDPEDRVFPFECAVDGIWSLDKEERLVRMRKSRDEKAKEENEEIELKQEMKRRGLK